MSAPEAAAATREGSVTPESDTGVQIASRICGTLGGVGHGGWRLTGWCGAFGRARFIEELCKVIGRPRPRAGAVPIGYDAAVWLQDASLLCTSAVRVDEVHLQVTQSDAERMGWAKLRRLVVLFESLCDRWQSSRFDVNVDVVNGADPDVLFAALRGGQVVTHVAIDKCRMQMTVAGSGTLEIGRRVSDRMLRVYRAEFVHADAVAGTVRYELELKGDAATAAVRMFFGLDDSDKRLPSSAILPLFWSMVRGFVDFCDRANFAHTEDARRHPLSWWAELVGGAAVVRLERQVAEHVEAEVARAMRWARSWRKKEAIIARGLGFDGYAEWKENELRFGVAALARAEVASMLLVPG